MKILYVTTESPGSIGVRKKIYSKIRCLNELGIDAKAIYFSESIPEELKSTDDRIKWIRFVPKKLPEIFNRRFFWQFQILYKNYFFYKALGKSIKEQRNFDFLILRYPGADLNLLALTKKYNGKVVLEHNSKELSELALNQKIFLYNYYYRSEKNVGPRIIRNARGIMGVTEEITNYQIKRSKRTKPSITISNGFSVSDVKVRSVPSLAGEIKILFLIGSGASDWYGIDRLIKSVAAYKGDKNFKVYIVGNKFEHEIQMTKQYNVQEQFVFTGFLEKEALDEMFDQCHVAVAALAMYRIDLTQAAALKVKEYLSRGIPFILGYDEVDLLNKPEENEFCIKFSNDDSLIDMNKVSDFVSKTYSNKDLAKEMNYFAKENIDHLVKTTQLKKFLESI